MKELSAVRELDESLPAILTFPRKGGRGGK